MLGGIAMSDLIKEDAVTRLFVICYLPCVWNMIASGICFGYIKEKRLKAMHGDRGQQDHCICN